MTREYKRRLKLLWKLCERLDRSVSDRSLNRLSDQQLEYINHRLAVACHLEACPGSGKTEVVGVKAAYEFAAWCEKFAGIAILTFTRAAAAEIKERVIQFAGGEATKHPHFVGTIDSWVHSYILQPFGHEVIRYAGTNAGDKSIRIIESDSKSAFLNNYRVVAQGNPISANEYCLKRDGTLEGIKRDITGFDLDQLQTTKSRFLADGFATYQDAEAICYQVLELRNELAVLLARRFPHVIVDECQDLSDTQLWLLHKLLRAGISLHFVGDLDQAIYEFRKVNPDHVESFVQRHRFLRRTLTNNYRSNQDIVDLCSRLMGNRRTVQGCRPLQFAHPCILWQFNDDTFPSLPHCFNKLIMEAELNPRKCCIAARGKALLKQLRPQREAQYGHAELFATAIGLWNLADRGTVDMSGALDSVGKSVSSLAYAGRGNHQKQYCPEHLDSKDWRILLAGLLDGARYLFQLDLTWTQWTAELRSYLERIWPTLPGKEQHWSQVRARIKAPNRQGGSRMMSRTRADSDGTLRITTIHDVKGETFDALLLISSKDQRSPGGHFEHWLHPEPGKEEYQRFAYVACSRPRHLLVIATPQLTATQLSELAALGLDIQDLASWLPTTQEGLSDVEEHLPAN